MACLYNIIILCKQYSSEAGTSHSANKAERGSILTGTSVDCSRSLPTDKEPDPRSSRSTERAKAPRRRLMSALQEALKVRKGIKKAQINLI